MNLDREVVRDIRSVAEFFKKVDYPAQSLHPETKTYLDSFFGGESFVRLCDRIFGSYYDNVDPLSWMDVSNFAPNGRVAAALFELIAPATPFITLLEAFSMPSPTFARKLRDGWKSEDMEEELEAVTRYSIDLPLSDVYAHSFKLLGEAAEEDLYTFPRSRCPAFLFVPFWSPPLVTRREYSRRKIMTSMRCSPLAYFIWRLFFYVVSNAEQNAQRFLSHRKPRTVFGWARCVGDNVLSYVVNRPPIEFPFYSQIITAYIQYYVTPSLQQRLFERQYLVDMVWTTNDVIASLLLTVSTVLPHKTIQQPGHEYDRRSCYDATILAQLVASVPFLSQLFICLHQRSEVQRAALQQVSREMISPDFSADTLARASCDVMDITRSFYRNCLITMRECFLSLDGFPHCRSVHFNSCLDLWLTTLNPFSRSPVDLDDTYVIQHFEAFTFLTVDVLNMVVNSSFLNSVDSIGSHLLAKCLETLCHGPVNNLFKSINNLNQSSMINTNVVGAIFQHCALNWVSERGMRVVDLYGDETCELAAHVFVLIEGKLSTEIPGVVETNLRMCLSFLERAIPGCTDFFDKWKNGSSSSMVSTSSSTVSFGLERSSSVSLLSNEEKEKFLKGGRRPLPRVSRKMLLSTNNGTIPGGHHPSLEMSSRNEIPALVKVSRTFDTAIEKLRETYYSNWIPKCDRGHNMWLLYSQSYSCCNHSTEQAIWECTLCELVYGKCCRALPVNKDGQELHLVKGGGDKGIRLCSSCSEVLPSGSAAFSSSVEDQHVLCPGCASRPFDAWSARWMASYSTWAWIICLIILWVVLRSIF